MRFLELCREIARPLKMETKMETKMDKMETCVTVDTYRDLQVEYTNRKLRQAISKSNKFEKFIVYLLAFCDEKTDIDKAFSSFLIDFPLTGETLNLINSNKDMNTVILDILSTSHPIGVIYLKKFFVWLIFVGYDVSVLVYEIEHMIYDIVDDDAAKKIEYEPRQIFIWLRFVKQVPPNKLNGLIAEYLSCNTPNDDDDDDEVDIDELRFIVLVKLLKLLYNGATLKDCIRKLFEKRKQQTEQFKKNFNKTLEELTLLPPKTNFPGGTLYHQCINRLRHIK